jgi:hypothetical protein
MERLHEICRLELEVCLQGRLIELRSKGSIYRTENVRINVKLRRVHVTIVAVEKQ